MSFYMRLSARVYTISSPVAQGVYFANEAAIDRFEQELETIRLFYALPCGAKIANGKVANVILNTEKKRLSAEGLPLDNRFSKAENFNRICYSKQISDSFEQYVCIESM